MTFDVFVSTFLKDARTLAAASFESFRVQAEQDAWAFLESTRDDLRRWTLQLAESQITTAEFEDLARGRIALAQMASLAAAGIALAQIQRFRSELLNLVVTTAAKTFL